MQTPNEMTYEDVKKLLYQLVWQYGRGDWEEAMARANLAYARAYRGWQPGHRTRFSTYLHRAVVNELLDFRAEHAKRSVKESLSPEGDLDRNPAGRRVHLFDAIRADLSDDARLLVQLVIDTPGDLVNLAACRPANCRRRLYRKLKGIGWSMARVINSFDEVREVLT